MVKGMACSDIALRKVSKGPGQKNKTKTDQIGIELERLMKMLLK